MKTELFELQRGDKVLYSVYETVHIEGQKAYDRLVAKHILTVLHVDVENNRFYAYHDEGYRFDINGHEDFEKLPMSEKKLKGW